MSLLLSRCQRQISPIHCQNRRNILLQHSPSQFLLPATGREPDRDAAELAVDSV